jgi:hypothetical protein
MANCRSKKGYKEGGKVFSGISEETKLEIENAVSEAMSDPKKNPTSKYNTLKGRNNTLKRKPRAEFSRNIPKTPNIPKDPSTSGARFISTPSSISSERFPRDAKAKHFATQKFGLGGEVEGYYLGGDVRTNPKRGKCY